MEITYKQFQQYHFDTNWTPMLHYVKELPPMSGYLRLDGRTDIFEAKGILDNHLCLFGNPKPSLFRFGTEEEVERQVKAIIDGCAAGAGGGREPVGLSEIRLAHCTARW